MKTRAAPHRAVIKTLAPTDRGALTLAQHYGEALICVRHRTDPDTELRHTTVELLVRTSTIRRRPVKIVKLRTQPDERALHAILRAAGGVWDVKARIWRLPSHIASKLRLRGRIVKD